MLTSCSHLLLPKKVQSILTVSPVRIGRLQQKCISICYSKKRDLFLSVRFCLEGAKTAESEEQDYLQSRGKEKTFKKGSISSRKIRFQMKIHCWIQLHQRPAKSCAFSWEWWKHHVQPAPRNTQTGGFLSQEKVFFSAPRLTPDCYFESVMVWLPWLLEARPGN